MFFLRLPLGGMSPVSSGAEVGFGSQAFGECLSLQLGVRLSEPPTETDALVPAHHSSFMTLPPNAILVPSHLILLVLRANSNVASLLSQSS